MANSVESEDLVSVITPCYNSARFIVETIRSIQEQTYQNWELLITDDCSTDNSVEIVKSFVAKDTRIKLFQLEKNSGAGACRNNSIRKSKGRFIAFCDSDDRWYPEKLEKQIIFMKQKRIAVSYTSYDVCNEDGSKIIGVIYCKKKIGSLSIVIDNGIGCLTGIYDTKICGKVYMPEIRKRQDWALWISLIRKSGCAFGMSEVLSLYRNAPGSISSNKLKLLRYNWTLYRDILGFSSLKTCIVLFFFFLPHYVYKKVKIKIDSKKYLKDLSTI